MTVQAAHKPAVKPVLDALHGKVQKQVPFWLMRQAGRYLPEYRELRQKVGSFLGMAFNPDHATEITLQPIRRFDMDAAIVFSDILVVPYAMGQTLDFVAGEGPQLGPLDIDALAYQSQKLDPVFETLRRLRRALSPEKTLIGFAGAPFTVACYMVDGDSADDFLKTKQLAFKDPARFDRLIDKLVDATVSYLADQARAGADAVQIFDSWSGLLPEPYFTRWVTEPTKKIVQQLQKVAPGLPVIGFPRGSGIHCKNYAIQTGVNAVGIDTQTPLDWAFGQCGNTCLQGNLDPVLLLTGGKPMEDAVKRILDTARGRPFIFNLGHGIIKETPPDHVAQLARIIREHA